MDKDQAFEALCKLQQVFGDIYKEFSWFLNCGTLLGAVREKDFIEWDDDIDIIIHQKHSLTERVWMPKLIKLGFDGNFQQGAYGRSGSLTYKNVEIHIVYAYPDGDVYSYPLWHDQKRVKVSFDKKHFIWREAKEIRGTFFPGPAWAEDYLTALYGDWKKPIRIGEDGYKADWEAMRTDGK